MFMEIIPGHSLGSLTLDASLHSTLVHLKSHPETYPKIDVSFSTTEPIASPVAITLPKNGIRLRFDGPDQRLRLIEVIDFTLTRLSYSNVDVAKIPSDHATAALTSPSEAGPRFRHVYDKLLGPTYAGEYVPPLESKSRSAKGTYILSYPGIAFNFPITASVWSKDKDFVSLLSSSATSPATSLAIFHGDSWPEARKTLFTRMPISPRSMTLARHREYEPDEIESATIHLGGRIDLHRRTEPPFTIILSETTPQDLLTELGPPDAIYAKNDRRLSIHKQRTTSDASDSSQKRKFRRSHSGSDDINFDTDHSSLDPDEGEDNAEEADRQEAAAAECFWNYFHHGFDVFISQPTVPVSTSSSPKAQWTPPTNHLTATKLILHSNVPGSYSFQRYRRSRWTISTPSPSPQSSTKRISSSPLTSETPFPSISKHLQSVFEDHYSNPEDEIAQQRGMVLNRGWADSPGSSMEVLGGWEEGTAQGRKAEDEEGFGNTELFGFPGLVFEVLKNGAVGCLTVY